MKDFGEVLHEEFNKVEEYYVPDEKEHIIWDSEINIADEIDKEEIRDNEYQDYLDNEVAENNDPNFAPMTLDEYCDELIENGFFDNYEDANLDDLEENILPEIDKQLNYNYLMLCGGYNSNYPDFKPSGKGGTDFEGTEEFRDYISNFDRVAITSTDGVLGAICGDHDGTVAGQFYTLPEKLTELAKAMNYQDQVDIEEVEGETEEDRWEAIMDQFEEDILYGGLDYSDFKDYLEYMVPVKDTISMYGQQKESKEIITESEDEPVYYNILHGEDNKYTLLVKTSKRLKGKESDTDDTVLMQLIDALEDKELIDPDLADDLEFGKLKIEWPSTATFLIDRGFTCYDLTNYKFEESKEIKTEANQYQELKDKHQKEFNEFPIGFAFSNEQFKEQMEKLGLTVDDEDKVVGIGAGGFIKKDDVDKFNEMNKRHRAEEEDAIKNDTTGEGYIKDMFDYELANHEYGYTYDLTDTLASLGLSMEDINKDKRLQNGLNLALKRYDESKELKTEIASRADKDMLEAMNKFIKKNKLDPNQYKAGTFRIRMKDVPPQEVAGIITEYNGMEYGFRYLAGQDIWTITLIQTGASVSGPYDYLTDAINDLPNIDKKIDEYVQTNGDVIDQMTDKFNYITKAIDAVYKAGSVPSLIKAVKNIKGLPENAVKDIIDRINNNLQGDFTVSDYEDVQDMVVAKLQKIKEFNESKRIVTESVDPNNILKLFASKFNTSVQKNIYGDKYVEIPKEALQKQFPDMNITASSLSEVKQLATENGFKFNQKITNLNDDVIYGYVKEDVNLDITDADLVIMVFCYK